MGLLITVEGGEYTGKTSLIVPGLSAVFKEAGITVKTSREPGGTPRGEKMREHIFKRLKEGATQEEMALLMNQARKLHLDERIIPFLGQKREKKGIMILDRYLDSTVVYQGLEGQVAMEEIMKLEKKYVSRYYPDLTLITYFPEKIFESTFKARKKVAQEDSHRTKSRWDEGNIEHHFQRQQYYLRVPQIYKQFHIERKFALIDTAVSPINAMRNALKACMSLLLSRSQDIDGVLLTQEQSLSLFEKVRQRGTWNRLEALWEAQQTPKVQV